MESSQPIISLCIPTNGVVKWVIPTIKSIYDQNISLDLFEVVVTDNGTDDELAEAIKQLDYSNLKYYRTNERGFVNQIASFRLSNGLFCKMVNHRSCLRFGMLAEMIELVKDNIEEKPILYFSDGHAKGGDVISCSNADEFVQKMSYWISWSAGVGLWNEDKPMLEKVVPNQMFPHMCLMFDIRSESNYIIWNKPFQQMQDESGKGGYDIFYTFAVVLNNIVNDLRDKGKISKKTLEYVRGQLFNFICGWYLSEVIDSNNSIHTFEIKNIKQSMKVYYGLSGYYWMVIKENLLGRLKLIIRFIVNMVNLEN